MTQQAEGLVAGIRGVEWDAVELPSQFMENWCYNRATLNTFGRHYETNEPLPEDLYKKLVAARTFRQALDFSLSVSLCVEDSVKNKDRKIKKERGRGERRNTRKRERNRAHCCLSVLLSVVRCFMIIINA